MMLDREGVELQRERDKSKIKKGGPWVITGNLNRNFLGPKFRELDSKYEFDRTQGNDGYDIQGSCPPAGDDKFWDKSQREYRLVRGGDRPPGWSPS